MSYKVTNRARADKRWQSPQHKMTYWNMRLSICWMTRPDEWEAATETTDTYKQTFYKEL